MTAMVNYCPCVYFY